MFFYLQIRNCEDAMKMRGETQISHEDVLFVMRKNKVRAIHNFSIVNLHMT